MVDPIVFGKPLRLKEHRRFKVSDYHVIYRIKIEIQIIIIIAIKHRKDVYEV